MPLRSGRRRGALRTQTGGWNGDRRERGARCARRRGDRRRTHHRARGSRGARVCAHARLQRLASSTPGFIDIHSHADWLLPDADHGRLVEPFVRQGMTTLVAGNCGFSPAPISARSRETARGASRLLHDGSLDPDFATMGSFLDALERGGVALNVAQLVGPRDRTRSGDGCARAGRADARRTGRDGTPRRGGARRRLRGRLDRARLRARDLRGRGGTDRVREDGGAARPSLHLALEGVLVGERRLLARPEGGPAQPRRDPRDPARGARRRRPAPDQPPDLRRAQHLAESRRGAAPDRGRAPRGARRGLRRLPLHGGQHDLRA